MINDDTGNFIADHIDALAKLLERDRGFLLAVYCLRMALTEIGDVLAKRDSERNARLAG